MRTAPVNQPSATEVPHAWAWVVVLAVGITMFELTRRAAVGTANPRLLPAMVLFGTLVVPATFLTFVAGRRIRHEVSPGVLMVVAVVGGCVSVAVAAFAESAVLRGSTFGLPGQLPISVIGVVEEGAKLLVPVLALVFVVPRRPINGLLIGVATGAGFAVLETLGYVFVDYLGPGGGTASMDAELLFRSLLTPATHMAWAGLTGCAFGYAASHGWRLRSAAVLVTVFAVAVALHALWDAYPSPATYTGLSGVDLALLAGALHLCGGRDMRRRRLDAR